MSDLRLVSATVAHRGGPAGRARRGSRAEPLDDPIQQVYERMWQPRYPEIEAIE